MGCRTRAAAEVHHPDPVGHGERLLLIVRHQNRRDPELPLYLANGPPQALPDLGIEGAERLIEQQHFRLVRQRPGHRHALLLSAGELRRQPLIESVESDEAQQLLPPPPPLRRAHPPHPQRKLDVLRHGHVPEQGVVLEHQPHPTPSRRNMSDIAPVQRDAPVVQPQSPAMARSSVLLPLPLGPRRTKNSPSPISSETSLTTGTPW